MHSPFFISRLFWGFLAAAIINGCASVSETNPAFYSIERGADYPVEIVAASFVPPIDIDIELSGKTDGALSGAGRALLECSPALAAGPYAPFIFLPCAAIAGVVAAAIGASNAAPKDEVEPIQLASQSGHGTAIQETLAETARIYLSEMSTRPVKRAGPTVIGPGSIPDRPEYQPTTPGARGSLLELSLLQIRYEGSGNDKAPVCLRMVARGRKIDALTGRIVDELEYSGIIECQTVAQWLTEGGVDFSTALQNGFRILAEVLVDELYLVYYPPRRERGTASPERPVPEYVLAPITPQAPAIYLDFGSGSKLGGLHSVDIDSLTPTLRWETFPRSFDTTSGENRFTNITYDVRIYRDSEFTGSIPIVYSGLQTEVVGLAQPYYSLAAPLQPCSSYTWTVRACFELNGIRRTTEWAGAYNTVGGEIPPSYSRRGGKLGISPHNFYYPFRTPGPEDAAECRN